MRFEDLVELVRNDPDRERIERIRVNRNTPPGMMCALPIIDGTCLTDELDDSPLEILVHPHDWDQIADATWGTLAMSPGSILGIRVVIDQAGV